MGRFSKDAKNARAKTNERLKAEMDKFLKMSDDELIAMLPSPPDREAHKAMAEKVNRATTANERAQAIKEFGLALTEAGARGFGKLFDLAKDVAKAAAMILLLLSPASAAESMSFGEFLKAKAIETKAIYSLTWRTRLDSLGKPEEYVRHAGGAYVPINTLTSKDQKFEYIEWGVGLEEPEGTEDPGLIVPVMFNVIDVAKKIFSFAWARDHVKTTSLPSIWGGVKWNPPTKLSKKSLRAYKPLEHLGPAFSVRFSGPWFKKKEEEDGGPNG